MNDSESRRRLAAILAADVVGWSRLIESDEEGTIARWRARRAAAIDPAIAAHGGRIFKTMGDGLLAVFPSAVEAARCALAIQESCRARDAVEAASAPLALRIAVHVGDVVVDGDDLQGDGVNVAARVQALAPPGGVAVTEDAQRMIRGRVAGAIQPLGEARLKNIAEPVRVFALSAEPGETPAAAVATPAPAALAEQDIRFCTASDGVRIAWSAVGAGPPLVKAAHWLTHLEFDWDSPIWRAYIDAFSRDFTLVRYDERGNGLSDREVEELSLDAFVRDLEAVVDAAGLQRFALFGLSQGASVSIAYAVKHPERVSHLVILGGFARGWMHFSAEERQRRLALVELMRTGWGAESSVFRQMFASIYIPDGTGEQVRWMGDLHRICTTPEIAARLFQSFGQIDVSDRLARVKAPTLVLHCRGDTPVPFEGGRRIASGIPGARFVPLESRNHILLAHEPAFARLMQEVRSFLLAAPG